MFVKLSALAALVAMAACSGAETSSSPSTTTSSSTTTTTVTPTSSTTTTTSTLVPEVIAVQIRVERRTGDEATAGFADVVKDTLADPRGWVRAGFRFEYDQSAPYLVVLAEGDEVDQLCLPYDTYGRYSCQNGPVVALNADRWRTADPKWTGDLPTYRQMLVNHEVGHLLGQKHPRPQCPRRGDPAPVMNQQSTELNGCLPNPWPLQWEIDLAARRDRPLAPPPDR